MTTDGGCSPVGGGGLTFSADGRNVTFPRDPVYPTYCGSDGRCRPIGTQWAQSALYAIGGQGHGQLRTIARGGVYTAPTSFHWTCSPIPPSPIPSLPVPGPPLCILQGACSPCAVTVL